MCFCERWIDEIEETVVVRFKFHRQHLFFLCVLLKMKIQCSHRHFFVCVRSWDECVPHNTCSESKVSCIHPIRKMSHSLERRVGINCMQKKQTTNISLEYSCLHEHWIELIIRQRGLYWCSCLDFQQIISVYVFGETENQTKQNKTKQIFKLIVGFKGPTFTAKKMRFCWLGCWLSEKLWIWCNKRLWMVFFLISCKTTLSHCDEPKHIIFCNQHKTKYSWQSSLRFQNHNSKSVKKRFEASTKEYFVAKRTRKTEFW